MIRVFSRSLRPWLTPLLGAFALIACSYARPNPTPPNFAGRGSGGDTTANRAGGEDSGILFVFPRHRAGHVGAGVEIGVNPFLWRGALLTLGALPLVSADPFGGVIITDWFSPADSPGERFKESVFIFSRDLRSDAVRVNVFRQVARDGRWIDAPANPAVAIEIQGKVVQEARRLQARGRRQDLGIP
jgi:uncharacterized protein DUF3576